MNFAKINLETWDRQENYNWFTTKNRCKINMTMNIDVTDLVKNIKERRLRCYPTFTYITSKVLNTADEYKMSYDEEGNLGVYDIIHPRYPIFHDSDKRISILWTEYSDNFKIFYDRFINDINIYGANRSMTAKGKFPPNCFDMSSLPWSSFTSFDCHPTNDTVWLAQFVMVGNFFEFLKNYYYLFLYRFIMQFATDIMLVCSLKNYKTYATTQTTGYKLKKIRLFLH